MKTANKLVLSTLVVAFFTINTATFAQVGIGTATDPDVSSMLEIQSTTKGVLIPRMLTTERTAIASPANGLLVFDSETKSFWFYNGTATVPAWKELTSGSSLIDDDGDTRVEVEKTADEDMIRFTTAGTEYLQIGSDGVIKLGNRAASTIPDSDTTLEQNYTKITTDGSLSYVGNATRWDDLKVPVNSVKIGSKKDDITFVPAEWDPFKEGGLALLWFDNEGDVDKEQDIVFTVQMPHGWKEGSAIFPHVHWTTGRLDPDNGNLTDSPVPGATRVTWALEYTWTKVGDVFPGSTTITGTTVAVPNGATLDLYEHVITPIGTSGIAGTGQTLSSMLVCRLYRNSSAGSDDYSGDAGLLEIDFHYQIDSDGSNEEYIKR